MRELWSKEEKKHLRPGHFWACELGDADGKGSPILHTFTRKNEYFTLSNGEKVRHALSSCGVHPLSHGARLSLSRASSLVLRRCVATLKSACCC